MSRRKQQTGSDGARQNISAATKPNKAPTKSAVVLTLLRREEGASAAELVEATGWQPHTTRAMLTGLRKKGHSIERRRSDDATCYYLPATDA